jgi:hypothetical protein
MSRYSFSELLSSLSGDLLNDVSDPDDVQDMVGRSTSIGDWKAHAECGWDDGLETYFIVLSLDDENAVFWYGTSWREISSPHMLTSIIERLFDSIYLEFSWNQDFIKKLVDDRWRETGLMYEVGSGARSEMSSFYSQQDSFWKESGIKSRIKDSYMESGIIQSIDDDDDDDDE